MTDVVDHVLALEAERCRCIVEQRFDRLKELLSERLMHVHTRGNVDDRASYLAYISGTIESLELRREQLRVITLADNAAVMLGKQINRVRKRGDQQTLIVEATVTQTWAREDDGVWRLIAFQATSLGPPPPPLPGR